jgi:hypothetical protein
LVNPEVICSAFSAQPAKRSVSPNAKGRRALVIKVPYVNDLVRMIKRKKPDEKSLGLGAGESAGKRTTKRKIRIGREEFRSRKLGTAIPDFGLG